MSFDAEADFEFKHDIQRFTFSVKDLVNLASRKEFIEEVKKADPGAVKEWVTDLKKILNDIG